MTNWPQGSKIKKPPVNPSGKYGVPRPNGRTHQGADFLGYLLVKSVSRGRVTFAGKFNDEMGNAVSYDFLTPSGAYEVSRLGGRLTGVHGHLARWAVSKGNTIDAAKQVGTMGQTGNAQGNCDHFEIRHWNKEGTRFETEDPEAFIARRIKAEAAKPAVVKPPATVRFGSTGATVKKLQKAIGFKGKAVDGIFGPKTLAAVKAFQKKRKLTVDGIVGPKTWRSLGF